MSTATVIASGLAACVDCGAEYLRGNTDECAKCGGKVEPIYTGPELAHLTGATYRQIDFWTRTGLLHETARGSGSRRTFTPADVDLVRLVVHLLGQGLSIRAAFAIAEQVTQLGHFTVHIADIYQFEVRVRPDLIDAQEGQ